MKIKKYGGDTLSGKKFVDLGALTISVDNAENPKMVRIGLSMPTYDGLKEQKLKSAASKAVGLVELATGRKVVSSCESNDGASYDYYLEEG